MNFSQKIISEPGVRVLFKPQCQRLCKINQTKDMISPPDPISNLRHIKYAIPENETEDERKLRKHRQELQVWNEVFWTKHNLSFIQKKKEFEEKELSKKGETSEMLSADEISVFYKDFLDKNWKTHLKYLFEWYKRNVYVTFLHFKVSFLKMCKKSIRIYRM